MRAIKIRNDLHIVLAFFVLASPKKKSCQPRFMQPENSLYHPLSFHLQRPFIIYALRSFILIFFPLNTHLLCCFFFVFVFSRSDHSYCTGASAVGCVPTYIAAIRTPVNPQARKCASTKQIISALHVYIYIFTVGLFYMSPRLFGELIPFPLRHPTLPPATNAKAERTPGRSK